MNNISVIGKKCCGCRGCEQTCPTNAITFKHDDEGFMQPSIDETLCISCGKCLNKCPIQHVTVFKEHQLGYAAKATQKSDLLAASSGGVFYELAKEIINGSGHVCGCSTGNDLMPMHIIVSSLDGLKGMRGSKYVQSNTNNVYSQIKNLLINEKSVLFSGTPCQVAGLRNFLGKEYENLYCVDIICHGVPSRKLYCKYLEWLSKKTSGRVVCYDFRDKRRHQWSLTLSARIETSNGKFKDYTKIASLDPYYFNFLRGTIYRESCYTCPYSQSQRSGDVTIGDFWGIEKSHPELFDINGVSCVLINSAKGKRLWGSVTSIEKHEVPIESIISFNGNLRHPTKRPAYRDSIYKDVNTLGISAIRHDITTKEYLIDSIKNHIPNKIRYKCKMILRQISRIF